MSFVIGQYVRCVNINNTGIDDDLKLKDAIGKVEEVTDYNPELPYWVDFGNKIGRWYMSDENLEDASEMQEEVDYSNAKTITIKFHESVVAEKLIDLFEYEIIKTKIDEDNGTITYILMEDN